MYRICISLFLALAASTANAQDILNELRRDQSGQGKIVVNQSREIEQLVNPKGQTTNTTAKTVTTNTSTQATKTTTPATKSATPASTTAKATTPTTTSKTTQSVAKTIVSEPAKTKTPTQNTTAQNVTPQQKITEKPAEPKKEEHVIAAVQEPDTLAFDTIAPVVTPVTPKKKVVKKRMDTVKADGTYEGSINLNRKVMRHAYKQTGYRIQVYNGGNTRVDRQKCEQIAARIKASYPNLPIYVHFYSPSWKCRAGNFTDKAEADKFLKKIKGMGYSTACLVKGVVSVQY